MHPGFILGFQVILVILFGVFVRFDSSSTTAALTYSSSFTGMLTFLLGFAMVGSAQRHLSWSSLGNVLVVVAISYQWSILWTVFWNSCFLGFSTTFNLSISILIRSAQSSLCALLIVTDLIGKLYHTQIMFICLIANVGSTLNAAIFQYALKIFDGGCGMQVFLLSGTSFMIAWLLATKLKAQELRPKTYGYNTETMGLIGLLLVIYSWPSFNMAGAVFTQSNTLMTIQVIQSSAFFNTIFGLTGAILFSLMLTTPHSKTNLRNYVEAIISVLHFVTQGGIMIASFTDLVLNPVMAMILGGIASLTTITLFKYFGDSILLSNFPQPSFRILFGGLSGIFAAIAAASHLNDSTSFANNLSQVAGLELAGIAITAGVGCIIGVFGGLVIVFTNGPNSSELGKDTAWWEVLEELKQTHQHQSKFKEVDDFSPRIVASLLPKYKLDIPDGAGTIRKSDSRPETDRNPSEFVDNRNSMRSLTKNYPDGSIVRQAIYQQDPRKSEDFAARPTNMTAMGHIVHQMDEPSPNQYMQPVSRQLDFGSVHSEKVEEEGQPNEIH